MTQSDALWLHPSFGARAYPSGAPVTSGRAYRELQRIWSRLDEEARVEAEDRFFASVLGFIAALGPARFSADLPDRLDREAVCRAALDAGVPVRERHWGVTGSLAGPVVPALVETGQLVMHVKIGDELKLVWHDGPETVLVYLNTSELDALKRHLAERGFPI